MGRRVGSKNKKTKAKLKAKTATKAKAKTKAAVSKKATDASKPEMIPSSQSHIDLEGLPLTSAEDNGKKRAHSPKYGFEGPARTAFNAALRGSKLMGISEGFRGEIEAAQEALDHADQLEPYEKWLQEKLGAIVESRRAFRAQAHKTATKLVRRARLLEEESPGSVHGYKGLLSFYSRDAQKAAKTRRRNKAKAEKE